MKIAFRFLGMMVLAAAMGGSLGGCANPKSLAKQSFEISAQALPSLLDQEKNEELRKKAVAIEEKVAKLSEENRKIYHEELAHLAGGAIKGLFE